MTSASRCQLVFASLLLFALTVPAVAAVDLVAVDVPHDQVWVGQKASFFVKLRGKGPFVGAASFSLPQVPRTVILKVGNPVVSSEELEEESWFVQTHEFALFSQADGTVQVPAFEVRFANRDGFTGPAQDHQERVPVIEFQVARPQGSKPGAFLVTTESLKVEQKWEPAPGATKQGAVFHRTITQQAEQIAGMALAPPPETVPEGVRVHFDDPTIIDDTERGAFTGRRTDQITYVFTRPGTINLPAIKYVWWNPESKKFGSTTLAAATFQVAAITPPADAEYAVPTYIDWLPWLLPSVAVIGIGYWQRQRLEAVISAVRQKLNPPERQIARRLLKACQRNDAVAADAAWGEWQSIGPTVHSPRLSAAAAKLQRALYGPRAPAEWDGAELASAFKESIAGRRAKARIDASLPGLNPTR